MTDQKQYVKVREKFQASGNFKQKLENYDEAYILVTIDFIDFNNLDIIENVVLINLLKDPNRCLF